MPKDYYVILGIDPDADLDKIKRAYRERAKQHHPDANESDRNSDKFIEVQEAYQTLSNAESRRRYDRALSAEPSVAGRSARRHHRRHGPGDRHHRETPGTGVKPQFSGARDIFLEIILTPGEASEGGMFPISIPVEAPCPHCRGTERFWNFACPHCFGAGTVRFVHEFTLQLPPEVASGSEVRLSLARTGLPGMYLRLRIRVESGFFADLW